MSANTDSASQDVPSVSSPGAEPVSKPKGLTKGSVEPRPAPTAEPATSGDVLPEAALLVKRPRRFEITLEIEPSQRVETALEVEVTTATDPSSSTDPATATEVLPTTDTARAVPASSPAPSSRPDNLDNMLANTPPATVEASGFSHLHIPRSPTGQEKEDQLSRAVPPPNLQSELEAAKADNLHLKAKLDDAARRFEATIAQRRGELNSVKADAEKAVEKFHQLEVERATEKEKLRVFEEKAETRAQTVDKLKSKLEEATAANDLLQTELESVNQVQITLLQAKFKLEENLQKAEADLEESLKDMEAAEAHTMLSIEYERWKSR
ncbi:uncharacterized protein LOC132047671 [Lycium ferocissimum]|uniref:uncharacterized protein LOC132047671 n=1 Tax=Lycium ferocissimum TaxID=112874 RepID=UPI0028150507|nr:uncharacterized protein LOC132047671 [Lycium ferocissimum]